MNIGKKIIEIRKKNNLSQEDLAKMFFVTRQTISSWECGKSYPDIETIIKISDKFNVSLDKLLKGDKKMVKKIDKKVRLNKYLIITLIILIIISIPLGIYGYKKNKELQNNSVIGTIPEDYAVIELDLDNIKFSADLTVGDYIDYYVDINNSPLYQGIKIESLRNDSNKIADNITDAKYLYVSIPDSEFGVVMRIKALNSSNIEMKKSKTKNIIIDNSIRNEILDKFSDINED